MTVAPGSAADVPVGRLDLAPAVTVSPAATLRDVAVAMVAGRCSAVLVGEPAAIVTERDVVTAVSRGARPAATARDYATEHPYVVPASCRAIDALRILLEHEVRNLVVVDEYAEPLGVLTLTAAAAAVLGDTRLPTWLHGLRLALRVEMHE